MNNDELIPIAYELLMMKALREFLELKRNMPGNDQSMGELEETWLLLTDWTNTGVEPDLTRVPESTRAFSQHIIEMRRSKAARIKLDQRYVTNEGVEEDDGLYWLDDVLELINSAISDPGLCL
jgi:hypothetical protein